MTSSFMLVLTVAFSQVPPRPPNQAAVPFTETAQRVALERLVRAADVVAALEMDDPAKANLKLLTEERDDQANRVRRLLELAPGPERSKLLAETIAAPASSPSKVMETLKEILGEEKFKRLQQIQRQLLGPAVVFESADDLRLTSDQRTHLTKILRDEAEKAANDGNPGPAFLLPDGRGGKLLVGAKRVKDIPELHRRQITALRKALTIEQQRTLDDLLGAPSGVVFKETTPSRQYGRRTPVSSFWHASQLSPVIYLGLPEVRQWLAVANWSEIENSMVEENDIEAVVVYSVDRLASTDAEALAHRALMARKNRMLKLEESVFRLMSAHQVMRLKNLRYQADNSAPYSSPTAALLGVSETQCRDYLRALQHEVFDAVPRKRLADFDHWRFLTPEQRKKWDEMRGEPVPQNLLEHCSFVTDARWRPQLREGLAAKLPKE